jgi:hypothetical protein
MFTLIDTSSAGTTTAHSTPSITDSLFSEFEELEEGSEEEFDQVIEGIDENETYQRRQLESTPSAETNQFEVGEFEEEDIVYSREDHFVDAMESSRTTPSISAAGAIYQPEATSQISSVLSDALDAALIQFSATLTESAQYIRLHGSLETEELDNALAELTTTIVKYIAKSVEIEWINSEATSGRDVEGTMEDNEEALRAEVEKRIWSSLKLLVEAQLASESQPTPPLPRSYSPLPSTRDEHSSAHKHWQDVLHSLGLGIHSSAIVLGYHIHSARMEICEKAPVVFEEVKKHAGENVSKTMAAVSIVVGSEFEKAKSRCELFPF